MSDFPDTVYNFGAVMKGSKQCTWTYTSIEYIFDEFLHVGVQNDGYILFGHSAGGQFAHRMTMFAPKGCRALQIVAGEYPSNVEHCGSEFSLPNDYSDTPTVSIANAGWYTLPSISGGAGKGSSYPYKWPYSLVGAPVKVDNGMLELAFNRKLVLMLGLEDVGLAYLRVTPAVQYQGGNRFERGLDFFINARKMAKVLGCAFNWSVQTVPQVEHSNKHMAFVTAARLFTEPLARVVNDQLLYDEGPGDDDHGAEPKDGQPLADATMAWVVASVEEPR
jgi:hypothetical protein